MRSPTALLTVALLTLSTVSGPTAEATTLIPLSNEQLTDAADAVVRGTVTEVWTETDASTGYVWTHAQVEVISVLKGDASLEALVIEQPGGAWAHRATTVAGSARFSVGEEAYFFVEHLGSDRTVTVGLFQGKFNIQMDPYSRQHIVNRFAVGPTMDFDHRFIPLPPEADRVNTLDFEEHILTHLAEGWDGQPIPGVSTEKLHRINTLQDEVR